MRNLTVLLFVAGTSMACSSVATVTPPPPNGDDASTADASDEPTAPDAAIDPHVPDAGPVSCSAPTAASGCSDGNPDSWVFGIARFNPQLVPSGAKPVLRLALRHRFLVYPTENVIGGRLHVNLNVSVKDVASGQVAFSLDMCGLGTAMWSEENDKFNLVGILDFNGNNDLDTAQTQADSETRGKPDLGEPTTLVANLDVSCHQAGSCIDMRLECIDGTACTTITPITSCKKTTPACQSDSVFCN
jgi:hypothetical protein